MTDVFNFTRDVKCYIEVNRGTGATAVKRVWEIPIMSDPSFSQGTNTTEITLNEAADSQGNSRRGRRVYNDSYAPAEWSISTYVRPFKSAGTPGGTTIADDTVGAVRAVEDILWALLVGDADFTNASKYDVSNLTPTASELTISFANSNKTILGTCDLYFVMNACQGEDETIYKLSNAVVNEASIDYDIDGIAMITWSGFASIITEDVEPTVTTNEAIDDTDNYIRNRLTQLTAIDNTPASPKTYDLTITGGNLTISNNISYLTPDTTCIVNQPIGHITGTRSISGNFTNYLITSGLPTPATDQSADLFEDLIEATEVVTHNFELSFKVGGTIANTPRIEFNIPKAHLEIPVHNLDDAVMIETTFHALPSSFDQADELTVVYKR